MSPYELKRKSAELINFSSPSPYYITIVYVIITHALSTLSMNIGGQPFVLNMDAFNAGNYDALITYAPENVTAAASAFMLAAEIIFVMLDWGYQSYSLHVARKQKSGYFDLMDGFFIFFRALAMQIVKGILVYFGLLLFVIPGILIAYLYSMSQRLQLDHPEWSPFRCMRESRRLMIGRLKEYFLLRLSLLGWNIIAILPVTSILAKPYVTLCLTQYYLQITGTEPDEYTESDDSDENPPWEY